MSKKRNLWIINNLYYLDFTAIGNLNFVWNRIINVKRYLDLLVLMIDDKRKIRYLPRCLNQIHVITKHNNNKDSRTPIDAIFIHSNPPQKAYIFRHCVKQLTQAINFIPGSILLLDI